MVPERTGERDDVEPDGESDVEPGADEEDIGEREADAESEPDVDEELPADLIEEAERLTRLARKAVDDAEAAAYRADRDRRLAAHDFTARVREGDDTLVLHPDEWLEDGVARVDRVEDTSRAVERPLSGPGDPDDWEEVEEYNVALVERVTDEHGETHGANARAFADFMGNHYAKRMDGATDEEVAEFLAEYFPRNAWPTDEQRDLVESSVRLVFESTDR